MIRSQLPSILTFKADGNSACWQLHIDADYPAFAGHFPEHPVLPGVVQLDWAVRLGSQQFGYVVDLAQIEVLKFQQLITPDMTVMLEIEHFAEKRKLQFSFSDEQRRFASGRIVFNDEAPK